MKLFYLVHLVANQNLFQIRNLKKKKIGLILKTMLFQFPKVSYILNSRIGFKKIVNSKVFKQVRWIKWICNKKLLVCTVRQIFIPYFFILFFFGKLLHLLHHPQLISRRYDSWIFSMTRGEVPMSKVATNTNLKLPLLLKPASPGSWRQVKNFKGQW